MNTWTGTAGQQAIQLYSKTRDTYKIEIAFQGKSEGDTSVKLVAGNCKDGFQGTWQTGTVIQIFIFRWRHFALSSEGKMPVAVPGFKGGDRTSIWFWCTNKFIKHWEATGKPVVFCNDDRQPKLFPGKMIHSCYCCDGMVRQSASTAMADVLFWWL